jgi:dihydrofolate synthase/folylpolyglutamate synthase
VTSKLHTRLETLYGLERHREKLGLEGTRALLGALGNPHERFRSVHVAGTNGKGTTCALIERALREAGHRTGLYTSPHLVDFRERIRVGGRWVDEDWLDTTLARIEGLPEGRDRTFFEVCTALGFAYFASQEVDIAVVEVGLGGRLDCTNVITPEVSVITSIGLDHTEILGGTVAAIAAEKAGIIKPGVPVVASPDLEARAVVETTARERGAPLALWVAGDDGMSRTDAQRRNRGAALTTLAALEARGWALPAAAVARGLERARWPGRFERCPTQPRLWWDAAHNPQGFATLGPAWSAAHPGGAPPSAVILALSRDKDVDAVLDELRRAFDPLRLIVARSRSGRALEPEGLAAAARARGIDARIVPDVVPAIRSALDAGDRDVLLAGSLFAVGEAMETFGGAPGEWL